MEEDEPDFELLENPARVLRKGFEKYPSFFFFFFFFFFR